MTRFEIGDLRFTVLRAGELWLDGGAMFGVVPKVLWQKQRPADDYNRIRLAMNILLIESGKHKILVDTGAGTKWDEKSISKYRLTTRSATEILQQAELEPEQITMVVLSHLHFDHAGGNTEYDSSGSPVPSYPNARYVVQEGELETARWNNPRTRASYAGL